MTTTLTKSDHWLLCYCIGRPTACEDARTLEACRDLVERGLMDSERRIINCDGETLFIDHFQTNANGRTALATKGQS